MKGNAVVLRRVRSIRTYKTEANVLLQQLSNDQTLITAMRYDIPDRVLKTKPVDVYHGNY